MKDKPLTPAGYFYCKKCNKYKEATKRVGHYGPCKECAK